MCVFIPLRDAALTPLELHLRFGDESLGTSAVYAVVKGLHFWCSLLGFLREMCGGYDRTGLGKTLQPAVFRKYHTSHRSDCYS